MVEDAKATSKKVSDMPPPIAIWSDSSTRCLPPLIASPRDHFSFCAYAQLRHPLLASLASSSRAMLPRSLAACACCLSGVRSYPPHIAFPRDRFIS